MMDSQDAAMRMDRSRLEELTARERERFVRTRQRSAALFAASRRTLTAGVPMSWMTMWAGGFPLFFKEAHGARLTDVDGHEYVDLCLGDTGAMAGHAPAATVEAVERQLRHGSTTMLPNEDAAAVGGELSRRFGLERWQFALTGTDANRWVLRMARQMTGRPKVLVFSYCYHGTVDESFVVLEDGRPRSRRGNVGPAVDPSLTTKVVEFNDTASLEEALAPGDVACVLAEPALTNIGIVLPEPGFHDVLRELTRDTETLLVIDETHTFSAGPGGYTRAAGLEPDMLTIGKAIGGGVPVAAYGMTAELADQVLELPEADLEDTGGVGGTLAGNAVSLAAVRATLERVLTDEAFDQMIALGKRHEQAVNDVLRSHRLPWHIVRLGARAEYRFCAEPPRTGGEAAAASDPGLDEYVHLYLMNRGVLITPFHNMALMCPATTAEDVDRHAEVFAAAADELVGSALGQHPGRKGAASH
jgi:glutamate-1-semialdehyde 2,1-aminomutase